MRPERLPELRANPVLHLVEDDDARDEAQVGAGEASRVRVLSKPRQAREGGVLQRAPEGPRRPPRVEPVLSGEFGDRISQQLPAKADVALRAPEAASERAFHLGQEVVLHAILRFEIAARMYPDGGGASHIGVRLDPLAAGTHHNRAALVERAILLIPIETRQHFGIDSLDQVAFGRGARLWQNVGQGVWRGHSPEITQERRLAGRFKSREHAQVSWRCQRSMDEELIGLNHTASGYYRCSIRHPSVGAR